MTVGKVGGNEGGEGVEGVVGRFAYAVRRSRQGGAPIGPPRRSAETSRKSRRRRGTERRREGGGGGRTRARSFRRGVSVARRDAVFSARRKGIKVGNQIVSRRRRRGAAVSLAALTRSLSSVAPLSVDSSSSSHRRGSSPLTPPSHGRLARPVLREPRCRRRSLRRRRLRTPTTPPGGELGGDLVVYPLGVPVCLAWGSPPPRCARQPRARLGVHGLLVT